MAFAIVCPSMFKNPGVPGASRRLRVLVVHTDLRRIGGANAVAAFVLQALAAHHDVSLYVWERADMAAQAREVQSPPSTTNQSRSP